MNYKKKNKKSVSIKNETLSKFYDAPPVPKAPPILAPITAPGGPPTTPPTMPKTIATVTPTATFFPKSFAASLVDFFEHIIVSFRMFGTIFNYLRSKNISNQVMKPELIPLLVV